MFADPQQEGFKSNLGGVSFKLLTQKAQFKLTDLVIPQHSDPNKVLAHGYIAKTRDVSPTNVLVNLLAEVDRPYKPTLTSHMFENSAMPLSVANVCSFTHLMRKNAATQHEGNSDLRRRDSKFLSK